MGVWFRQRLRLCLMWLGNNSNSLAGICKWAERSGRCWGAKWQGNKADYGWNVIRTSARGLSLTWQWKSEGLSGYKYSWDCRRLKDKRALHFTRADRSNVNHEEGRRSECRNSKRQVQLLKIRPKRLNGLNPGSMVDDFLAQIQLKPLLYVIFLSCRHLIINKKQ